MVKVQHSLILYAEDPGAANFIGALRAPLLSSGLPLRYFAEGPGIAQLSAMGIAAEPAAAIYAALDGAGALVIGTSENIDSRAHRLVAAARERGVPSAGVVDAPSSAAFRFRGVGNTPLAHAPDWLLVPDDATMVAYIGLGHPAERIRVVGHPHYEQVLAQRSALRMMGRAALRKEHFPDAPEGSPVVVFLAELSDGLEPGAFHRSADYLLHGWGDDGRRTHIVLQEVLDALGELSPCPYTVLRLHPKNEKDEFARYRERISRVSRDEQALEIVYAADVVIGMSTILLAEAAILGRPVLSVLPREAERNWLPAVIGPRLPCVTRSADIAPAIRRLLVEDGKAIHPETGSNTRAARAILEIAGTKSAETVKC